MFSCIRDQVLVLMIASIALYGKRYSAVPAAGRDSPTLTCVAWQGHALFL